MNTIYQVKKEITEVEHIRLIRPVDISELQDLAKEIDGNIHFVESSCSKLSIVGVCDGRSPAHSTMCFLEAEPSEEVKEQLKDCIVITNAEVAPHLERIGLLVTGDPRALMIDMINKLSEVIGFHYFSSMIERKAEIHPNAIIHERAIIEDAVYIGENSVVSAGCVIKAGTYIADNVTIRENTVIGCDGIALYKTNDGRVLRFPHLAGVMIHENVEIGSNCVIPRGVMKSTHIGKNSVIGNLSNLGHAVNIGKKVWMSVGCLIGGNTTIGDETTLGLGVRMKDQIKVGVNCSIGMGSVVVKSLPDGVSVFGNPAKPIRAIKAGPVR